MEIISGNTITEQITAGPLSFYHRPTPPIPERSQRTAQEELDRFSRAQKRAVLDLAALYDQAFLQVGKEAASIFAIHAMLLEDEDFVAGIHARILNTGATAEWAVACVGRELARTFADLDDPYMQARAVDIQDISRRLMRPLMNVHSRLSSAQPSILVSNYFLPSEIMELSRRTLAVISQKGSLDSHTAILLRTYHIPAMIGTDLEETWDGHPALMDGYAGRLYLDPERSLLEELRQRYQTGVASAPTAH